MMYSLFVPPMLRHKQQVRRLCRLAHTLRQHLRSLPWLELSTAETRRIDTALDLLEKDIGLSRSIIAGARNKRRQGA